MIWITIVLWIMAIVYATYWRERIWDELQITYLGNNRWDIRCSNIFLAAAIIMTIIDMVLYFIVSMISLGGSLSFIW